jgi:hypothetical protein
MNIYYVYVIYRPDGHPCYIGKGKHKRWLKHFKHCRNPHLKNILDLAALNGQPIWVRQIAWDLTAEQANALERKFIAAVGRKGAGGPLANMTDGGEGTPGLAMSEEHKAKIGRAHLGMKRSPETCAKLSTAIKGRRYTPEQRARMGRPKGIPHTEEWKAGNVARLTGPETNRRTTSQYLSRETWQGVFRSPQTSFIRSLDAPES